jgi:hypothetical protein
LDNVLADCRKRSDGFVGSRAVIFHVKTEIGRKISLGSYGWNSTALGGVSFHVHQSTDAPFHYLGACNLLNPQGASGAPKVLKKIGLS